MITVKIAEDALAALLADGAQMPEPVVMVVTFRDGKTHTERLR